MFDWLDFLQQNNIHYVTSGPNTSKGQIGISCPWCGVSDEGQHLSINLAGKGFRCWRQSVHAGKNPARLIQALLNCSWEQASAMAGQAKTLPNDFMNKVKSSLAKQEIVVSTNKLKLPSEFKRFSKLPSCRMYLDYINRRGFIIGDTFKYGMYYASTGQYKGRVIFSITCNEKLVGWTGRTVYSSEYVRYKTLTSDLEKAQELGETPAPNPISHYLLFYDHVMSSGADTIVLVEGPFDALKVNVLGEHLGIAATCFFTSSLSAQQLNLLHELLPRFPNKYLLLDQNTFSKAARIRADLVALGVDVKRLSASVKDPGEIKNAKQLKEMLAIV